MIYTVYNNITGTESVLTQEELEAAWPELINGTLEVIDEIDPDYQDASLNPTN
jgi:hypothetical protein